MIMINNEWYDVKELVDVEDIIRNNYSEELADEMKKLVDNVNGLHNVEISHLEDKIDDLNDELDELKEEMNDLETRLEIYEDKYYDDL